MENLNKIKKSSRYKTLLVIIYCLIFCFYTIQIFSNLLKGHFLSSLESVANTLNGIGFPVDVNLPYRLHSTLYFLILSTVIIWLVKEKHPSTIKEYFTFLITIIIKDIEDKYSFLITTRAGVL